MKQLLTLLSGIGIGAAVAYFSSPSKGGQHYASLRSRWKQAKRHRRGGAQLGSAEVTQLPASPARSAAAANDFDVEESSEDSFPASDPPSYTGSSASPSRYR